MAEDKVAFELVTPEQVLASGEVDMVVVPGGDGDFGVLPGHAPLLSTLRPGVVDIYEGTLVSERVFVGGGFAEVSEQGFTVLADEAVKVDEIEANVVTERLQAAREAVSRAREAGDEDVAAAESELQVAEGLARVAGVD